MNRMYKRIALLLAAVLVLCLAALPACAEFTGERLYVNGRDALKVHLRSQPSTQSASLGLVYSGTEVILVFPENAEWYMVQLGAESGYISAAYLSREQPESKAPVAYVYNQNSSWSHLRKGASTQAQSVGRLNNDEVVYVLAELQNGWSYVQRGAQAGFVLSSFLRSEAPVKQEQSVTGSNQQPISINVEAVGNAANGDKIFRIIAPETTQSLFFTSAVEKPAVYQQDVDFDGIKDLIVSTASGASNEYVAFFVRRGYEYVPVQVPGWGYQLCNYQLYPQRRLVVSSANNGAAGALHETTIFCWDGTALKPLRSAVGEMAVDDYDQNGLLISATNPQLVRLTVRDHSSGVSEGEILYEKTVLMAAMQTELPLQLDALWQGLK